jgi:trimethylguanosine synthase
MKEVEVLLEVKDPIEIVLAKLEKYTSKGIKNVHDIYYYNPENKQFYPNKKNEITECLRVRKKDDDCFITYKHDKFDELGKWLYSEEEETKVESLKIVSKIIEKLGLQKLVEIKNNKHTFLTEEYEIVVEDVKGLGLFIEVECLLVKDDDDIIEKKDQIYRFIDSLCINTKDIEGDCGKPQLMFIKNKEKSPFGEHTQKYWDRRHRYFSKFDEGVEIDEVALYSVTPEECAIETAQNVKNLTVLDAFGCVGGNSMAFGKYCKKVYMIELDKNRIRMAKNNADVYGVKNITFIKGDYFMEAPKIIADVIYLDPPWGGIDYKNNEKFKLEDFSPDGNSILTLAFRHFEKVILKVPRNFDVDELKIFDKEYDVIDNYFEDKIIFRTIYFK